MDSRRAPSEVELLKFEETCTPYLAVERGRSQHVCVEAILRKAQPSPGERYGLPCGVCDQCIRLRRLSTRCESESDNVWKRSDRRRHATRGDDKRLRMLVAKRLRRRLRPVDANLPLPRERDEPVPRAARKAESVLSEY